MSLFYCDFFTHTNNNDIITLNINNYSVKCSKSNLCNISPVASQYFDDHPQATEFFIEISNNEIQENLIKSIFQNKQIQVNSENDLFLNEFSTILQIQPLEEISENWEIIELQKTEELIFNISEDDLNKFTQYDEQDTSLIDSMNQTQKSIFEKLEIVGKETFCRLIINACISRSKHIQTYLQLIQLLSIEDVFCRIILHEMEMLDGVFSLRAGKVQIICYLVRFFYDKGFIKAKKIQSLYKNLPAFFADLSDNPTLVPKELQQDNWSKFKKYVFEGTNPDPISRILRNDDIDSFQNIACQPKFDINETIKPSVFEACDFINQRPCSYLEFCAFFGSIRCFKFIFLNNESRKSADLFRYAVAGGNVEIIHICEHDGKVDIRETREIAVKYHHWDVLEWLSEHKYGSNQDQVSLPVGDMFSILYQSIQFSNFATFAYLIDNKIDYNLALPFAIDFDNVLLAKWLIKHKQNLFKEESSKSVIKSFLHFACRNENTEMLKLILSHKEFCNINAKYEGKTPIMIAIEKENFELYEILINQEKIKLGIRDFSGQQVIHFVCEYKNVKILEHLIQNKRNEININSCDKNNNTPLNLACEKGNRQIVQILLNSFNQEIKLNNENRTGYTPILSACLLNKKKKILPIIQMIYEHEIDEKKEELINKIGPMKKTLLHLACENREIDVVQYLLSLPNINVNCTDISGRTPLNSSAFYGFGDIIKLLLNHPDIDVDIKDAQDKAASDYAVLKGIDNDIVIEINKKSKIGK